MQKQWNALGIRNRICNTVPAMAMPTDAYPMHKTIRLTAGPAIVEIISITLRNTYLSYASSTEVITLMGNVSAVWSAITKSRIFIFVSSWAERLRLKMDAAFSARIHPPSMTNTARAQYRIKKNPKVLRTASLLLDMKS